MPTTLLQRHVKTALTEPKANKRLADFANLLTEQAPQDLFEDRSPKNTRDLIDACFDFIQSRADDEPLKLTVANPAWSAHTVIQACQKDQVFLVDTLWTELERLGYRVLCSLHPIISAKRTKAGKLSKLEGVNFEHRLSEEGWQRESLIYIEIPRVSSKSLAMIEENLREALLQAHAAVADFPTMIGRMTKLIHELERQHSQHSSTQEKLEFLRWLIGGHYIFLGYRAYEIKHNKKSVTVRVAKDRSLGILRDETKSSVYKPKKFEELSPNLQSYLSNDDFLTITKAIEKSRVHRAGDLDYIGIKEFDATGAPIVEHRFVGLFTSRAYVASPQDIPIVGHKINQALQKLAPGEQSNYRAKALVSILETLPKDELFQATVPELTEWAETIFHLQERPDVRLLLRRSQHERLVSALIFLPRDRMNSQVRIAIQDELMTRFNGEDIEWEVFLGSTTLARIYVRIRTTPPEPPRVQQNKLEEKISQLTLTWHDALAEQLRDQPATYHKFSQTFPASYRERNRPEAAVQDILTLEQLAATDTHFHAKIDVSPQQPLSGPVCFSLKVFQQDELPELWQIMPILQNFGLKVMTEHPSRLRVRRDDTLEKVWLQDFQVCSEADADLSGKPGEELTRALQLVWSGQLEDDLLNTLVLHGVNLNQLTILRGLCAYLHQLGGRFTRNQAHRILIRYPQLTKHLVTLFTAKHDPALSAEKSASAAKKAQNSFLNGLKEVRTLDEDRLLRRLFDIVQAVVRTSAWQRENELAPLSFKIASREIPGIVKPAPYREIFVYGAQIEGVHQRGGPIARGGLRWSDRPEDYRTEVLGLVKAQLVKNAIIVPSGSKGGFVLKGSLPADRPALMQAVEAAYKTFIRGLLCITDNQYGDLIVPPRLITRLDDDDPYLVVAADKGTATFSDIANGEAMAADYWDKPPTKGLSERSKKALKSQRGFWLGDAFASGGSNGYDHKEMGITARGAWECVKHAFLLLDHDIQREPFTCIGIGSMNGDVFGNGMLLSKQTKLVAAFNHRHIFIDPDPDPAQSWQERKRLFDNPAEGGWEFYNKKLISKGGGVFSRDEKTLKLSPEIQQLLDTTESVVDPSTLLRLLMQAPVDLIYNGGIGTYVKASEENHITVGDRANDENRVNGNELRCKVIGEGGNLGMTQAGRIEYALNGGLVNTDSIDNAAGVNTSDHEVNIKILLAMAQQQSGLTDEAISELLVTMKPQVADDVLYDNFLQAQLVSLEVDAMPSASEAMHNLQNTLVRRDLLDAQLEGLPDADELERRRKDGHGYTRPEISVLLSYAKLTAYDDLMQSDLPADPALHATLMLYFPHEIQFDYHDLIVQHPLRREIVATKIASDLVNRMGLTFTQNLQQKGYEIGEIVRAYLTAKAWFDAEGRWSKIESLATSLNSDVQLQLHRAVQQLVEFGTQWILQYAPKPLSIEGLSEHYIETMSILTRHFTEERLPTFVAAQLASTKERYQAAGLDTALAAEFADLPYLTAAPDVADISLLQDKPVTDVLAVYTELDTALHLAELHAKVNNLAASNTWQQQANQMLVEELYRQHRRLTEAVVKSGESAEVWLKNACNEYDSYLNLLTQTKEYETPHHAMLTVVISQLKRLCG